VFAATKLKLLVEPGGAAGLAALLAGRLDAKGNTVAVVLSGGNVEFGTEMIGASAGQTG
jgi:threonine dehydratase